MTERIRIGTRGSRLAMWQARFVADQLRAKFSGLAVDLVTIATTGDKVTDLPLSEMGGVGVFTKEIQRALLDNRADIAVHSLKDLPTEVVPGLKLAAVPARGPAGDVFISETFGSFDSLPLGSRLGTGSLRRRAMALNRRPDLEIVNLRGNVETRLKKLTDDLFAGIILAQAGLERLGLSAKHAEILSPEWMLPAVGQGAIGLEVRSEDEKVALLVKSVNHEGTFKAVMAERALLRGLGGGCLVPIGVHSQVVGRQLDLYAVVLSPDGIKKVEGRLTGELDHAEKTGQDLAGLLLDAGAKELLGVS